MQEFHLLGLKPDEWNSFLVITHYNEAEDAKNYIITIGVRYSFSIGFPEVCAMMHS